MHARRRENRPTLRRRRRPSQQFDGAHVLTATDRSMMQRAIELAKSAAEVGEVPIGAVIYRGDEIVAEAANDREATSDPTGHAELVAISRAGRALGTWRLSDCSLAVTLEPCPMCAGAMVNARLGRLVYGATDAKAGAVTTLYTITNDERLNHRVTVIGGVDAGRCRRLLRDFFATRRSDSTNPKKTSDR